MKHRHGGSSSPLGYDPNAELTAGSMEGRGKVYRGVPWYEKNKNPKIAQGYKPGRKYRHRKQKLDAKALKKLEDGKKAREREEEEKKMQGEEPVNQTPPSEGEAIEGGENVEGGEATETKPKKKEKKKKEKRKKKAEESNEIEIIEAPKKDTKKPVEADEKKDGF